MDEQVRINLGQLLRNAGASGNKAHVISKEGNWAVFKEGAGRILGEFPTRILAINKARELMRTGGTEMIVLHRQDGSVERVQVANQR
ncbi:MAG: DUF2188 domain-containing protein [Bacteroidia bacterium]|nr:DUF2188 domain-containing protein [Bacteroidia bacterium]